MWKNKDETTNKNQDHDDEMIREVKRDEVEEELRRQVDVLMREELDLLKIVRIIRFIFFDSCLKISLVADASSRPKILKS